VKGRIPVEVPTYLVSVANFDASVRGLLLAHSTYREARIAQQRAFRAGETADETDITRVHNAVRVSYEEIEEWKREARKDWRVLKESVRKLMQSKHL